MQKVTIIILMMTILPVCCAQTPEIDFTATPTPEFGESCDTAWEITSLPYDLFFSNDGLEPGLPKGSCNSSLVDEMSNDAWFRYTASQDYTLHIENDSSLYDAIMVLYIGPNCSSLTEEFCQNVPHPIITDIYVIAGETCWIQIGTYGSVAMGGNNDLHVEIDTSATPTPTFTPTSSGPGDNCTDPIVMYPGECINGSTEGHNNSHDCSPSGPSHMGADVVHEIIIDTEYDYWIIAETSHNADFTFATSCGHSIGDIVCAGFYGVHYDPICSTVGQHNLGGYFTWHGTLSPGSYYLWIDSESSANGDYSIEIYVPSTPTPTFTPCVTCPPGGTEEGEEDCYYDYDDQYNGGCNIPDGSPTPGYSFQPVASGEVVCGTTGWFDTPEIGDSRDMDWYEIEINDNTWLSMTLDASFDSTIWLFDAAIGCDEPSPSVFNTEMVCETNYIGMDVSPGTYWMVVGPFYAPDMDWPCGSEYVMEVYTGPSPTPTPMPDCMIVEDFEISIPPADWTTTTAGTGAYWRATDGHTYSGSGAMYCPFVAADHDEWLISPAYDLTQLENPTIRFAWITSYYWMVFPINNADFILHASTDGGSTWTEIWTEETMWRFLDWEWVESVVDMSAYTSETSIQFAWQYIGNDATNIYIDFVRICDGEAVITPTYTPTNTPTTGPGTPTNTPITPSPTPTKPATETPTATPTSSCATLGVDLILSSNNIGPGDMFQVDLMVCNPEQTHYEKVPTFVILDVYGTLFFAPSFSEYDKICSGSDSR